MSRSVIIVGGGASGLAAAITAAEQGAFVTLLERLPRVGKKLLLTGNGKCNLGNRHSDFTHYHGTLPQAKQILSGFDSEIWFRQFGLLTRTDSEGRMYPMSGTATSVLDALRFAAEQKGVRILCDRQVTAITQKKNKWQVTAGNSFFSADALILASGGSAAPNCGTDGNLLPMLRKMGYAIAEPRPALCPVLTAPAMVRALKGLRVRADVSAICGERILKTESGEVQFTEQALSGICIFNLSRLAAIHGERMQISLNLLPSFSDADTAALLAELIEQRSSLPASDLLTGLFPKRVGEMLLRKAGGNLNASASQISPDTQKKLLILLHDLRFPVEGTASFAQAQVTAGGISGQCVTKTLESKLHRGIWFCGELLDLDGDCGGYNLTWCWASGVTAGKAAANPISNT